MAQDYPPVGPTAAEEEADDMWECFTSVGRGTIAYLIHTSGEPIIQCGGLAGGFDVSPTVIQRLQPLFVGVTHAEIPSVANEGYELTEEGKRLYDELRELPSAERQATFLKRVRNS